MILGVFGFVVSVFSLLILVALALKMDEPRILVAGLLGAFVVVGALCLESAENPGLMAVLIAPNPPKVAE